MSLTIATWNINSVRLRIGNVERYLKLRQPDVLCLQETKCPDEFFPHEAFEKMGYTHRFVQGMKAYNGVAILSKVPFAAGNIHHRCGKEDCRHVEVALDVGGDPILLDKFNAGDHIGCIIARGIAAHKVGQQIAEQRTVCESGEMKVGEKIHIWIPIKAVTG